MFPSHNHMIYVPLVAQNVCTSLRILLFLFRMKGPSHNWTSNVLIPLSFHPRPIEYFDLRVLLSTQTYSVHGTIVLLVLISTLLWIKYLKGYILPIKYRQDSIISILFVMPCLRCLQLFLSALFQSNQIAICTTFLWAQKQSRQYLNGPHVHPFCSQWRVYVTLPGCTSRYHELAGERLPRSCLRMCSPYMSEVI